MSLPGRVRQSLGCSEWPIGPEAAIAVEVWTLDAAGFGAFVAKIPPPLGVGTIRLDDGSSVKGFLVEAEAVAGAKDITKFGGWRAYVESGRGREPVSSASLN